MRWDFNFHNFEIHHHVYHKFIIYGSSMQGKISTRVNLAK